MTAPAVPALVPIPTLPAPTLSAVEAASANARAAIAAGTLLVSNPDAPAAPNLPRVATGTPEGGQWRPNSLVREVPGGTPTEPAPPASGQPAPIGEPVPVAPPVPGAPPVVPGAPGAAEPAPTVPTGAEGGESPDELAVELPIQLAEGEEPFVIQADTPETAEAIREYLAEAQTAREATEFLGIAEEQLAQLEEFRIAADTDPANAAIDIIGRDAGAAEAVARFLLTSPTLFERLKPTIDRLIAQGDPAFRVEQLEANDVLRRARETARSAIETERAIRANKVEVVAGMEAMIPPDVPAERRQAVYEVIRDCVANFADANRMITLPAARIVEAARPALLALGIDVDQASARATAALARVSNGARSFGRFRGATGRAAAAPTPTPAAPPAPPPARSPAPRTGPAFVASAGRRAAVARVPGGGAGSPGVAGNGLTPPRNADGTPMNTAQALAWHRQRVAAGNKSY